MSSVDEADLQVVENRLRASATFSGCLEWKALNGSRDRLTQLLRPLKMVLIGRISLRRNNLPLKTAYRHTVWDKLKSAHLLSLGEQLVQLHIPPGVVPFAQIKCPVCLTPNLNPKDFRLLGDIFPFVWQWSVMSLIRRRWVCKLVFRRSRLWIWHQNVQFGVIFKEKSWKIWQQITHEMMCLAS